MRPAFSVVFLTTLIGVGQVRMTYDLGTGSGHELFAIATGYRNWQSRLHQYELFAASFETGLTFRTDIVDISPSLVAGYATLRGQQFQRSAGARLRAERALGEGWQLFGDALVQHQEFDNVNRTHQGEAIAALTDSVKADPTDPVAWYFMGAARWAAGEVNAAKDDFRQGSVREAASSVPTRAISAALAPIQGPARDALTAARP